MLMTGWACRRPETNAFSRCQKHLTGSFFAADLADEGMVSPNRRTPYARLPTRNFPRRRRNPPPHSLPRRGRGEKGTAYGEMFRRLRTYKRGQMNWAAIVRKITGTVDEHLVHRNAYLLEANRVLRRRVGQVRFKDSERIALAKAAKPLRRSSLAEVATLVTPEPCSAGVEGWSRTGRHSPAPGSWAGRRPTPESSNWWCASRERIRRGVTTGSPVL